MYVWICNLKGCHLCKVERNQSGILLFVVSKEHVYITSTILMQVLTNLNSRICLSVFSSNSCFAAPLTYLFVAAEDSLRQAAELLWYMGPSDEDDIRILQHRGL